MEIGDGFIYMEIGEGFIHTGIGEKFIYMDIGEEFIAWKYEGKGFRKSRLRTGVVSSQDGLSLRVPLATQY